MNKAGTLFLVLILSLPGVALNVAALTPPIGPETSIDRAYWGYEVETGTDVVRLVIRDQADQIGAYRAVFVVTAPDKQQYKFVFSFRKTGAPILYISHLLFWYTSCVMHAE